MFLTGVSQAFLFCPRQPLSSVHTGRTSGFFLPTRSAEGNVSSLITNDEAKKAAFELFVSAHELSDSVRTHLGFLFPSSIFRCLGVCSVRVFLNYWL